MLARRCRFTIPRRVDGEGEPGTVIEVNDDNLVVQAGAGRLVVKRVRPAGAGKMNAGEWAAVQGITSGTRLGL